MTQDADLFKAYCDLPICGCDDPDAAVVLIRQILERHAGDDWPRDLDDLLPDGPIRHIVLAALTNAQLLEHGGTIMGSWLTEEGKRLLASMQTFDPSDEDAVDAWREDIGGLEMTS